MQDLSSALLATPQAWLHQVIGELDPAALLSLFRTCRTFQRLVLSQRGTRLTLSPLAKPAAACHSLLLACKQSSSIKLALVGRNPTAGKNSMNPGYPRLMASAAGHRLGAIKSVTLQGLVLDALLPSWITTTCPNMTSLLLISCHYLTPTAPTAPVPCGQLQHLHVAYTPVNMDQAMSQRWQQQLVALTGLTSLNLEGHIQAISRPRLVECFSVIGSQLTQLTISTHRYEIPAQFAAWFPAVTELRLTHTRVYDADMQVLLAMPCVEHLQCTGFELLSSYTDRPCPWEHLTVQELSVGAFALLPLNGVRSFLCVGAGRGFTIRTTSEVQATERVVAAIARCGGLGWQSVETVMVDCMLGTGLAATLPLLSTCPAGTITLSATLVDTDVLSAISLNLAGPSSLIFEYCRYTADVWPLLLPSMPASLRRVSLGGLNEAFMTDMCVHACRPVAVQPENCPDMWRVGWQGRVRAAMAAAGHQHVNF